MQAIQAIAQQAALKKTRDVEGMLKGWEHTVTAQVHCSLVTTWCSCVYTIVSLRTDNFIQLLTALQGHNNKGVSILGDCLHIARSLMPPVVRDFNK